MTNVDVAGPELVEADPPEPTPRRRPGARGIVVTLSTVAALVAATVLTVLGLGVPDSVLDSVDSSSWLWSSTRGEVDRVNGVTARVDSRAKIVDSQNHEIQITQNDRYLILRDLETGQVTALDLTTLQVSAVLPTTPGLGVSVALHGDVAIIIDGVQGVVRQLDPRSLTPTGDPLSLRQGIVSGGFDGAGTLWVALPSDGTVVAIQPDTGGAGPRVTDTYPVADPGHDLVLSSLDTGVAVLDNTTQRLAVVTDAVRTVELPTRWPGVMPAHTVGTPIAVTIPTERVVLLVDVPLVDSDQVTRLSVAGTGPLGPAVVYAGRVYVPDPTARVVRVLLPAGQLVNSIPIPSSTGRVELEVREGYLFINSPDGPDARVVDSNHQVRDVDKYSDDAVVGGDSPPPGPDVPPPPPPPPGGSPARVPGAPEAVAATAGDGMVTVTWQQASDNGAAVTRYVVEGGRTPVVVGASQRQADITGLTNGTTYRFSVHAVNAAGAGPKAFTSNVVPSRQDPPDPPRNVRADAFPDGSVSVNWSAAEGNGRRVVSYRVTAVSGGGTTASIGSVGSTTMYIEPGRLTYGTQYAFTVVAVNDVNIGSAPSASSNTVTPYTTPGAPRDLTARVDRNQSGVVLVGWLAPPDNGRAIIRYEVQVSDRPGTLELDEDTLSVTLTGLPADGTVQIGVRAVNSVGPGALATVTVDMSP